MSIFSAKTILDRDVINPALAATYLDIPMDFQYKFFHTADVLIGPNAIPFHNRKVWFFLTAIDS